MRPPMIPTTITANRDDSKQVVIMKSLYNTLIEYREPKTHRILIQLFMCLPSRKDFPEYFNIIAKPIAMNKIRERIERQQYPDVNSLMEDFKLMFRNCKFFNEDDSQIYKDAVNLESTLQKRYEQLQHEHYNSTSRSSASSEDTAVAAATTTTTTTISSSSNKDNTHNIKTEVQATNSSTNNISPASRSSNINNHHHHTTTNTANATSMPEDQIATNNTNLTSSASASSSSSSPTKQHQHQDNNASSSISKTLSAPVANSSNINSNSAPTNSSTATNSHSNHPNHHLHTNNNDITTSNIHSATLDQKKSDQIMLNSNNTNLNASSANNNNGILKSKDDIITQQSDSTNHSSTTDQQNGNNDEFELRLNHNHHNETSMDSSSNLSADLLAATPVEKCSLNTRRGKNADAPKRQLLTGYIIYASEVRKQVIDKNPNQNFGDISRLVGNEWKTLPHDIRSKYDQRALIHNKRVRERAQRELLNPSESRLSNGLHTPKLTKRKLAKLAKEQMRQHHLSISGLDESSSTQSPRMSQDHNSTMVQQTPNSTYKHHHSHLHHSQPQSTSQATFSKNTTVETSTQTTAFRFVEPPTRKRLVYSDSFRKYIESLQVPNKDLLAEETTPERPPELPTHWLGTGIGRHESPEAALWALRDFMLQDAVTMRRSMEPYL